MLRPQADPRRQGSSTLPSSCDFMALIKRPLGNHDEQLPRFMPTLPQEENFHSHTDPSHLLRPKLYLMDISPSLPQMR